jgi:hypothetical protein
VAVTRIGEAIIFAQMSHRAASSMACVTFLVTSGEPCSAEDKGVRIGSRAEVGGMARVRHDERYWRERVEKWDASGLSAGEFATREGIRPRAAVVLEAPPARECRDRGRARIVREGLGAAKRGGGGGWGAAGKCSPGRVTSFASDRVSTRAPLCACCRCWEARDAALKDPDLLRDGAGRSASVVRRPGDCGGRELQHSDGRSVNDATPRSRHRGPEHEIARA